MDDSTQHREDGMKLKEFIKTSLAEIVAGVSAAQDAVTPFGGVVNPKSDLQGTQMPTYQGDDGRKRILQQVEFDVAVTVSSATEGGGGLSVAVPGLLGAKAGGSATESKESISRLRFHVPLGLPVTR